jgi:hypothetical protein
MSDSAGLERGYRRLLSWYPRSFRIRYEQEVLGVLMIGAKENQRRPGLAESVDLLRGALALRLRRPGARPPFPIRAAARLMVVGAVVEAAGWGTYLLTAHSVRSQVLRGEPDAWPAVQGHLTTVQVFAPVAIAFWLWMAWASATGRNWTRVTFTCFLGLLTMSVVFDFAERGGRYFAPDTVVTLAVWSVAVAVTVLLYSRASATFYRRTPGPNGPAKPRHLRQTNTVGSCRGAGEAPAS